MSEVTIQREIVALTADPRVQHFDIFIDSRNPQPQDLKSTYYSAILALDNQIRSDEAVSFRIVTEDPGISAWLTGLLARYLDTPAGLFYRIGDKYIDMSYQREEAIRVGQVSHKI